MSVQPQYEPQLVKLIAEALSRYSSGDKSGALIAYKRVQRQFPNFADAWINASSILFEMGRAEEALNMALQAMELAPENAGAYCALASAYQSLGRIDDAVVNFCKAIEYDPAYMPALTNLAGIYARAGNFTEALTLDDRAIQAQPSNSALWGNRGHTKMRALDLIGAEADLKRALELDSDNALARWNLAYVQLLQCRYREAWPNFKARRYLAEWSDNRQNFGKPHWNGEPLNGRTLLVYTEQGFGDTLHFVRFLPRLKQFGGGVLLLTYEPLKRLLSDSCCIDGLAIEGEPLPDFDLVVPLMELPVILNVDSSDLEPLPPPELPKCHPIPELDRSGFKIALVWAGSRAHTNDSLRSMNPRFLDELADIPGIAWYGLQKPPSVDPPKLPGFVDLSPHMGDFMDTAQIIKQLDLIVTVDTSMAHLAGFLGIPAIVLLAYLPDWRWGLGEHTPWYPTLTLLRQTAHGDWRGSIALLRQRITELVVSRKSDNAIEASNKHQSEPALVKLFKEALARQSQGDKNGAVIAYKRIQRQFPDFADAWINASCILFEMGRAEEALDMALRAVELAPENVSAYCALASAYQSLGCLDDAVVNFRKAIEYDPAHVPALTNLAGIYARAGNFTEALTLDDRAIQARPSNSALWGNRSHTKMRALDFNGAEADLKRALELDSDNAQARWNLACLQLLQCRYREAWSQFHSGHISYEVFCSHRFDLGKPHWNGEPLNGRTLLMYKEPEKGLYGFGDIIQYARFFPRIQQQYNGRVIFLTFEHMKRLLANAPGLDGLLIDGEPLPDFDLVVPVILLPVVLNADISDLPPPIQIPTKHRPMPEFERPGLKVGLVWGGSSMHPRDAERSMNPRFLDELADIPGIDWYGLQKPPSLDPPRLPGFIDMSPYMGDFMDTAQIARQLDLIVTVDTSMSHLAGSLGIPTIVLLTYLPDWRWGLGEHTPWYPNLTLLRQPAHGDWRGAIALLKQRIIKSYGL